jgi:hypothetical protein
MRLVRRMGHIFLVVMFSLGLLGTSGWAGVRWLRWRGHSPAGGTFQGYRFETICDKYRLMVVFAPRQQYWEDWYIETWPTAPRPTLLTVDCVSWSNTSTLYARRVTVSTALIALFVTVPAIIWTVRAFKRRRRKDDGTHCASCGYDLRASGNTCPECGQTRGGGDS